MFIWKKKWIHHVLNFSSWSVITSSLKYSIDHRIPDCNGWKGPWILSNPVFLKLGNFWMCGLQLLQFPSQHSWLGDSGSWDPHIWRLPNLRKTDIIQHCPMYKSIIVASWWMAIPSLIEYRQGRVLHFPRQSVLLLNSFCYFSWCPTEIYFLVI